MRRCPAALIVVIAGMVASLSASGQAGVFAIVERVVVEPTSGPAERIQVWGAFAVIERSRATFTDYLYVKPTRGYMYFKLPPGQKDIENARREWVDFTSIAGTKQAVGFGYWDRYQGEEMPVVRGPDMKPVNPDVYSVNVGLIKLQGTHGGIVDDLLKLVERR